MTDTIESPRVGQHSLRTAMMKCARRNPGESVTLTDNEVRELLGYYERTASEDTAKQLGLPAFAKIRARITELEAAAAQREERVRALEEGLRVAEAPVCYVANLDELRDCRICGADTDRNMHHTSCPVVSAVSLMRGSVTLRALLADKGRG